MFPNVGAIADADIYTYQCSDGTALFYTSTDSGRPSH